MLAINENNRKWWLLTAMAGGLGLVLFDETVVGVALPVIRAEFGMSEIASHWVVNSYLLVFAGLVAVGGRLGDILPLKPLFLFGTVVFGLSSAVAGFAPTTEILIAARAVQGIGAAIVFPLSLTIVTLIFPRDQHGLALGIKGTIGTVFLALGPVVGGFFADFVSWRWIFWINPFLAAAMAFIVVRAWSRIEEPKSGTGIDFFSVALFCSGLGLLVVSLMQAPDYGWDKLITILPFAAGVCLLAGFVIRELRKADPLINMRLFANSTFGSGVSIIFLAQFMKVCTFVFGALYFQQKLGMNPFLAGLAILPAVALQPVLAASVGRAIDRLGTRGPSILGCLILLVSMSWFTGVIPFSDYWLVFPAFLVLSLAGPLLFIGSQKAAMNSVEPQHRGQAGGIIVSGQMLGGTIGMAIASAIFSSTGSYQGIFLAVSLLAAATLLYAWVGLKEPGAP